jgi:type I restriction enzyme S subunit
MTRFVLPRLDPSWLAVPLGNLAQIKYGSALTSESRAVGGEVPVYGSGGIVGTHDQALHFEKSIVIGRKGSVGSIFLTKGSFWCIDTAYYLEQLNESVNIEYLAAYLQSIDLSRLSISVAIPGLNRKELSIVPVPLPTLPEQQRIVDVLRQAEMVAKLRNDFDKLLVRAKRQLFVEMFGNPNPKFNARWPIVKLGKFVTVATGGTPSRQQSDSYGTDHAWVKSTDLKDSSIVTTEEKVSALGIERSNAKLYPKQTIMLAMYGQGQTRGRTGKLLIDAACNQACAALLPSDDLISDYLWIWLQLSYDEVRALGRGGQQENLNLDIVRGIQLPKPPVQLQQKFSKRLTDLLNLFEHSRAASEQLSVMREVLQIEALTGNATAAWRELHSDEIAEAARVRGTKLCERGTKIALGGTAKISYTAQADLPVVTSRHWLLAELNEFQRQVLAAFTEYCQQSGQPLLVEDPDVFSRFCDDSIVTDRLQAFGQSHGNRIRRSLSQLAALGLIAKVTLPKQDPDSGACDYLKAFRPLRPEEFTRLVDVQALRKVLSPGVDLQRYYFEVQLDYETSEHAGASGMFQVISVADEDGKDFIHLVDQGQHYASLNDLKEDIARSLKLDAQQVDLEAV